MSWRRWGWTVCAAALLGACGGGGGGSSGDAAPIGVEIPQADYFPLAAGNRWTYRSALAGVTVAQVVGQQTVDGQLAWRVLIESGEGLETRYVTAEASAVRSLPNPVDPLERELGAYDLFRMPARVGESFVQVDKTLSFDVNGDGVADSVSIRSDVTVTSLGTVQTDAGPFDNALRTTTRTTTRVTFGAGLGSIEGVSVQDDWYAPGLGPVRSDLQIAVEGSVVSSDSRILAAYAVGGRRSDGGAPGVHTLHPANQSVRGENTAIRLTFSEPMDPYSLRDSGMQLVAADGSIVPGRIQWTSQTLAFVPLSPLSPGDYAVRVPGRLLDLAGNAAAALSTWTFTAATGALEVAAVLPTSGAVDVPVGTTISVTFDEEPDPSTVDGHVLLLDQLSRPVAARIELTGRTLTLTPAAPLVRANNYLLSVTPGLKDRYGNSLVMHLAIPFFTSAGPFKYCEALHGGITPQGNGVADVNGDDRADLVILAQLEAGADRKLHVLAQRADATLAAPMEVSRSIGPLYGSACAPDTFVLRDMNRDGRADLVLSSYCGIEVLLQQPGGMFAESHFIDFVNAGPIEVGDIDGDGLPDIMSRRDSAVHVWKGRGAVSPLPLTVVDFGMGLILLRSADLNHDGLRDIAATTSDAFGEHSVVWRLQQPGGSFGPVVQRSVSDRHRLGDLVIGDVTGDGRDDIVVAVNTNSPTYLGLLRQQVDGSMGMVEQLVTYDLPGAMALADVNRDGVLDIVVGHEVWSQAGVYSSSAVGLPGTEVLFPIAYEALPPGSVAVGDLNNDGLPDIVVGSSLLLQKPPEVAVARERPARRHASVLGGPAQTLQTVLRGCVTLCSPPR